MLSTRWRHHLANIKWIRDKCRYHWKFHRPTGRATGNQIRDAFGKRRSLGRCGGGSVKLQGCGWLRVGRAMSIVVYNIA